MIRGPILGIPVPTGLTTEKIKFESLTGITITGITIPLTCPACSKVHQWQRKQAWVENEA
jgi:hypothetical protein